MAAKAAKKKIKQKSSASEAQKHLNMKIVTSDVCAKCRKCARGLKYLEKMSEPGAVGNGVPCILTRGRP